MKERIFVLLMTLVMLLSMAACHHDKEDASAGGKETSSTTVAERPTQTAEKKDNAKEDIQDISKDLKKTDSKKTEDSNKISFVTDNTTVVFYHEGQKITGHEIMVDYGSADVAKAAYEAIKMSGAYDTNEIKDISLKGQYMIFTYAASEYQGYTLDEVREMAANTQEALK